METVLLNIRYALRKLRKNPGFAAIAVLTLSLGIGATTAIFSVVYGLLLRQLPYEKADQIVRIWELNTNRHRVNCADPNFEDLREQNHSFEGLAASDAHGRRPTVVVRILITSIISSVAGMASSTGKANRGFARGMRSVGEFS